MALPTVAITGASSFTGFWICRAFLAAGWNVHGLCARPKIAYSGLKALRISELEKNIQLHFALLAQEGLLSSWIKDYRPGVWVHHHHFMENFRSKYYDLNNALRIGIQPLPDLLASLKQVNCLGIIYSGTYYEPNEGGQAANEQITPYAKSKYEVWNALRLGAAAIDLQCSKIVIANPIGPLENNDRLIPQLLKAAKAKQPFRLLFPKNITDNIPVTTLAESYVKIAGKLIDGRSEIIRPSGWVGTNGDWVEQINEQLIKKRLGYPPCTIIKSSTKSELLKKLENPSNERLAINWKDVWDDYYLWINRLN